MPQPQPPEKLTLKQQFAFAQWLMQFPAMTLMVVLRRDLGFRFLNPIGLFIVCAVMFLLGGLITDPEKRPQDLQVFAGLALGLGLFQWLLRLRDVNRGEQQHSYYIGTSCFDAPFMPSFLRSERRIARFIDPALSAGVGLALLHVSPALGRWIVFSALCLRVTEFTAHRLNLQARLDMVDALRTSEVQGQIFDPPQSPGPSARSIPSGLGGDIKAKVKAKQNLASAPEQAVPQMNLFAAFLKPPLTRSNVVLAFLIAVLADALHLASSSIAGWAANTLLISQFAPALASMGHMTELIVDGIAMLLTIALLGFQWALLPSVFVQFIPGLSRIPTWTGCVAYVVWQRRKERAPVVAEASAPESPRGAPENRLTRLAQLHRQGLITEDEYQTKRRMILEDL